MMYLNDERDTKHVISNGKCFCVYCGKEIVPITTWDEYFKNNIYHCDCDDANTEHNMKLRIAQLEIDIENCRKLLPKPKFGIISIFGEL